MSFFGTLFGGGAAALAGSIGEAGDKLFTSDEERMEWRAVKMKMAADLITAEAKSEYWLAGNWRPITALTFVALIVSRWMGWAPAGMSEAEYLSVYELVKIMIGGYVLSRGAEKGLRTWRARRDRRDDPPDR